MKQERNYSVEFWRFFLCITFMLIHVFMIYPVMYWHIPPYMIGDKIPCSGAMDIIIIFYIVSGYFLMSSYKKNKEKRKDKKTTPAAQAGKYLLKRLKGALSSLLNCFSNWTNIK